MRLLPSAFVFFVSFLCMAGASWAQERSIRETDLFKFTWMADPQLSSDAAEAAYVLVNVDAKREGYQTRIWSVATASGEARPITTGPRDSAPRWSPDGQHLAFLRQLEKEGKPEPAQIWVAPRNGGQATQLTRLPKGAASPHWSPDGKTIAFLSNTNEQDLAHAACMARPGSDKQACTPVRSTDVRVITRSVYRANGSGYVDFARPARIWAVGFEAASVASAAPRQLTRGLQEQRDIAWSPDSARIYFVADRHAPKVRFEHPEHTVYSVAASGGEPLEVLHFAGRLGMLSISPDGKQLAFLGSPNLPVQSHVRTNLWVAMVNGSARNVTAKYDWDIGGAITGDQSPPRAAGASAPIWSRDGASITVVVARHGRAHLERIKLDGGAADMLTSGDQAVTRYSGNGVQTVALVSSPTELNELYLLVPGAAPRQLTQVNRALFSEIKLSRPLDVWYRSADGRKIHALVQTPPGFNPKLSYPMILNIHGGPHAAYGYTFFHEVQWMAAKGYLVLYTNPRGSTTYGQAFANIIQYRYPGDDYKDLMAGVDDMVRRGWADPKRLGVTGGSGGGLLTNWVIGKTRRFTAAVSQRDIADWTAWWYSADNNYYNWFRKPPFDDPADFRKRSPITYVKNITTPTMFILGDADSRTPPEAGGDQMFRAMAYRNVPTAMVRFPGESHELSRSGTPWHRVERLQHIVNWFDLYLLGKKTNEYDLAPPVVPDLRAVTPE